MAPPFPYVMNSPWFHHNLGRRDMYLTELGLWTRTVRKTSNLLCLMVYP